MEISYGVSIETYRAEAARRFLTASASVNSTSTELESKESDSPQKLTRYEREQFPALEEYLRKAASEYAKAKLILEAKQPKRRSRAQVLGHGEPVPFLHAALRRERWLHAKASLRHLLRAPARQEVIDVVVPCGIPSDVLQRAASLYLQYKKPVQASWPSGTELGRVAIDECLEVYGIRKDPGYCVHIGRCEDVFTAGKRALLARRTKIQVECDTFEEVRKKYAGRPDELYRRKTARKFATWRRKRREEEQNKRARDQNAENEMKRRRGHDRLLSTCSSEDSSFVPFLFDLSNNTYAYSSKITEAPKLRKVMIEKYTGSEPVRGQQIDQWESARQAVETNPSFQSRVMNRFS